MAGPITWRNVSGPSLSEASAPLAAAQRSFGSAFDDLGGMVDQHEADKKAGNTAAFLNTMSQYRTPEALQEAMASGAIDAQRAQYGYAIDQDAIRGAADERMTALYGQANAANTFGDDQRTRAEAPGKEAVMAAIAREDWAGARQGLDAFDYDKEHLMEGALSDARYQKTARGYDAAAEARRVDEHANTQTLTGLEIGSAKRTAEAAENLDSGSKLVDTILANHRQVQDASSTGLTALAAELGVPLDAAGIPDLSKVSPAIRQNFADFAEEAGLGGGTTNSQLRENVKSALIAANVSGANIQSILKNHAPLIDSTAELSASDSRVLNANLASLDKKVSEARANNPFLKSKVDPFADQGSVLTYIDTLIEDGDVTRSPIRTKAQALMTNEIKLGGKLHPPPPPAVIRLALTEMAERDSWLRNETADELEEAVKKIMLSKDYVDQYKTAQWVTHNAEPARDQMTAAAYTEAGITRDPVGNLLNTLAKHRSKK